MNTPQLGFGIMRFKEEKGTIDYDAVKAVLDEYMRGEYCYFDLHPAYISGQAQFLFLPVYRKTVFKGKILCGK